MRLTAAIPLLGALAGGCTTVPAEGEGFAFGLVRYRAISTAPLHRLSTRTLGVWQTADGRESSTGIGYASREALFLGRECRVVINLADKAQVRGVIEVLEPILKEEGGLCGDTKEP